MESFTSNFEAVISKMGKLEKETDLLTKIKMQKGKPYLVEMGSDPTRPSDPSSLLTCSK